MLIVERVLGYATVQDLGRPGHMHEAVPPGGALVRTLLVAANRRAGNADDAAAIEVLGQLVVRAEAEIAVATDAQPTRRLHAGEQLVVAAQHHVASYLAVRGGIDAPVVLGGRGALVSAQLGTLVKAGDRIASAGAPAAATPAPPALDIAGSIRVIAGPDLDAFEPGQLDALTSSTYRISTANDRTGYQLEGPAIARRVGHVDRSRPMVRGAIQIPPKGQPIVLGPDHPVTGGYALIAVVASDDLDRMFARPAHRDVRFVCDGVYSETR